jgi:hypothetical protein
MTFALLKDSATEVQMLIRDEHVSAVAINTKDQSVTVYLVGGQTLQLTHDQSKQYVQHIKTHVHTTP